MLEDAIWEHKLLNKGLAECVMNGDLPDTHWPQCEHQMIVAGLDLDFRGEPFGPMPALLCRADEVQKLHAICMVCGEEATRTQRLVNGTPAHYDDPIIQVGAAESYEARCREHHIVPGRKL